MITRRIPSVGDIVLAVLMVSTIAIMLIPMPPLAIDFLIATNLAASVLLLLVAMVVRRTLDISTFPAMILITTLFRLAINISSTRRILLDANPGTVIKAFGNFVVSGSLIVGAVVFLILTIVQFLVIAKGAERAAEVSARFTLDALPGRQMAIEADLRSGLISTAAATQRRTELRRESQLFSSLEGAMKFVKGDAVASLVIIAVNIVGGLSRGVVQLKMPLADALSTYTLLTIGDGLASQVPALLITTAAGMVMTRVDSVDHRGALGRDIGLQLLQAPRSLWIATAMLAGLSLVPGLPLLPFLAVALVCGGLAASHQHLRQVALTNQDLESPDESLVADAPSPYSPLALHHGPLTFQQHRQLQESLLAVVAQQRERYGLPSVALPLRPAALTPGTVQLRLRGVPAVEIPPIDGVVAVGPVPMQVAETRTIAQTRYHEGYVWLPRSSAVANETRPMRQQLEKILTRAIRLHLAAFMNPQVANGLLERLALTHDLVVQDLRRRVDEMMLSKVFALLLAEGIPLTNLLDLVLAIADWSHREANSHLDLTQRAREAIGGSICHPFDGGGTIRAVSLDYEILDLLRSALSPGLSEGYLTLERELSDEIAAAIGRAVASARTNLIVAPRELRYALKHHFFADRPDLHVIAESEIPQWLQLSTVETSSLGRHSASAT